MPFSSTRFRRLAAVLLHRPETGDAHVSVFESLRRPASLSGPSRHELERIEARVTHDEAQPHRATGQRARLRVAFGTAQLAHHLRRPAGQHPVCRNGRYQYRRSGMVLQDAQPQVQVHGPDAPVVPGVDCVRPRRERRHAAGLATAIGRVIAPIPRCNGVSVVSRRLAGRPTTRTATKIGCGLLPFCRNSGPFSSSVWPTDNSTVDWILASQTSGTSNVNGSAPSVAGNLLAETRLISDTVSSTSSRTLSADVRGRVTLLSRPAGTICRHGGAGIGVLHRNVEGCGDLTPALTVTRAATSSPNTCLVRLDRPSPLQRGILRTAGTGGHGPVSVSGLGRRSPRPFLLAARPHRTHRAVLRTWHAVGCPDTADRPFTKRPPKSTVRSCKQHPNA